MSKKATRFNKGIITLWVTMLVTAVVGSSAVVEYHSSEVFAGETLTLFEKVWNDYDQNYSYFTYKNIDWDQVKVQHQPNFVQELSADEFGNKINAMLQVLHDWHVWVGLPDGTYVGYNGSYDTNYPPTLFTKYTKDGYYQTLGDNVIFHAIVDENIAHIVIDTLSTDSFSAIPDSAIENLFTTYANTDGIIIDIRANNGGSEDNAAKFASHFTDTPLVYGYVKYRTPGTDHDDFGELITKTLEPSSGAHYANPAVCLIGQRCMSSAEWFTLMMRACPHVTLIGDHTRGASGSPQEFSLSNGVSYSISTWIAYTAQMVEIEDKGIQPAITIPSDESYDSENDYVLERAISYINEGGSSTTTTGPPVSSTTTTISGDQTQLTADPTTGPAPLIVNFTCVTNQSVVSYAWDFGDDSPEETTTSGTITHTYLTPGSYIAFVSLYDNEGFMIDLASAIIEVTGGENNVCPIESLYRGNESILTTFRTFRDTVLSKHSEGKEYISLYYRHAPEIVLLFSRYPGLKEKAKGIISALIPLAKSAPEKRVTPGLRSVVHAALVFMDEMIPYTSPVLKKDLTLLKKRVQNDFVLKSFGIHTS